MKERCTVRWLVLLTGGLGLLHLWMAGALQLAPDEAYYWTWSKDLALSYPDHPPLVAWLIAAGTALGGDTEVGVRLWFVLLGTALVPLSFALARRSGARPGIALLVASAVGTSLLGSAGAMLATPETPLAFGWTLGLVGLVGLATRERPMRDGTLLAAGAAIAAASKLTGVLLVVVAVASFKDLGDRRSSQRRWILLAFLALGWTTVNVFGSSTFFQLEHGLWAPELGFADRLAHLGAFLGAQLGLLTPLLAVAVVVFLVRRQRMTPATRPLCLSAVVPWGLFGVASLLARPEANWPACAHVGALVGAGLAVQGARDRGNRWASRGWIAAALGFQVIVSLVVHVHLVRPFLPLGTESSAPFIGPTDPTARLRGWRELAAAVKRQGEPIVPDLMPPRDPIPAVLEFYGLRPQRPDEWQSRSRHVEWEWWSIEPLDGRHRAATRDADVWSQCTPLPVDPSTVDRGLVHPTAPVRIRRWRCEGPSGRIR